MVRLLGGEGEEDGGTLVDRLIEEQQRLTAVERFSQKHERETRPLQKRYYQDLIPLSKPGEGEQYAFEVDLEACSGCKACVTACHSLNGLEDGESWRDVGLLLGEVEGLPVQRTVTTACHHCGDPACANGCPVLAYDKDVDTGVVRHLDDQCIGCRYCELKCPYDVPKYSRRLGIVRKCDLCQGRLAEGEAPACVQACPNEAIRIRVVERGAVSGERLVASSVRSDYTKPATVFKGGEVLDGLEAGDGRNLGKAHAHLPLVWMLVMTQAAAGMLVAGAIAGETVRLFYACAALIGVAGIGGSVLHLGRPMGAWRAFLGWRKSWLSREIIAFNLWLPLLMGAVLLPERWVVVPAALVGCVAVFTSVMVYADTRRRFWAPGKTGLRFFGTAALAGCVAMGWPVAAGLVLAAAVLTECAGLLPVLECDWSAEKRSALVQVLFLKRAWGVRLMAGVLGVGIGGWLGLVFVLVAELAGRVVFFQAVDEPKMPGGI